MEHNRSIPREKCRRTKDGTAGEKRVTATGRQASQVCVQARTWAALGRSRDDAERTTPIGNPASCVVLNQSAKQKTETPVNLHSRMPWRLPLKCPSVLKMAPTPSSPSCLPSRRVDHFPFCQTVLLEYAVFEARHWPLRRLPVRELRRLHSGERQVNVQKNNKGKKRARAKR